ncbi:MAG: BrxA/BrxB family bacilliredoxin [Myxococcota bacterium]
MIGRTFQHSSAEISAAFEAQGLGDAAQARKYLAGRENVGNHDLDAKFSPEACDRMLADAVDLMALPEERDRYNADTAQNHPLYQAMRFEIVRQAGVQTALNGAEAALQTAAAPSRLVFINSLCGCASGNVREAVSKLKQVDGLPPMMSVMDVGGCSGDSTQTDRATHRAAGQTLGGMRAVDYVRDKILAGAVAAEELHSAPAFVFLQAGRAAAFIGRDQLDKQPSDVVFQRVLDTHRQVSG